ncbi:MAG: formate dehydrogenase subunit gamma [Kiloniellales bacterium]|nr:formate dehydrogenase subunit gamma [Kiloniellales bacterium]
MRVLSQRSRRGGLRLAAFLVLGLALLAAAALSPEAALAQATRGDVAQETPTGGNIPGNSLGSASDTEIWRQVRRGVQGTVSIPDPNAAQLIQSQGESWRAWRNGPLSTVGGWAMLGMVILLALFFALRGRIKIDAGPAGRTVERFNAIERFAHWLTAVSFIVLAITGLNLLYGRYVLLPIIGADVFSDLTSAGKYAHNFIAFAFMLGVVMMVVLWIRHNIPNRYDLIWLSKAGGLFAKGVHPPSKKFNAGQKVIFWVVVLGGISISLSGIALLFPFEFKFFEGTYAVLNVFGAGLPETLTPMQEMQLSQLWHTVVGLFLTAVILAHIYIGSVGMEGAFAAMGSGMVDENWAREHHNLWMAELKGEPMPDIGGHGDGKPQPAE